VFYLSKLAGIFLDPGNYVMPAMITAVILLGRRPRVNRWLLWFFRLGVLGCTLVWLTPLPDVLTEKLEKMIPNPALPAHADGIIVLGGWQDMDQVRKHGGIQMNGSAERFFGALALAHRYPAARLVFTGGSAHPLYPNESEAAMTEAALRALNFPMERAVFERKARDTYENAVYSRDLVQPKPSETWILLTNASHIPRAMACFRRVGWTVIPHGVDFQTHGRPWFSFFTFIPQMDKTTWALHEWFGLLGYWLAGRLA